MSTTYKKINYPAILLDDAMETILDNLFSDDTKEYLSNTTLTSDKDRFAFIQGMNYANLILATKCFKFRDTMFSVDEIERYNYNITQ